MDKYEILVRKVKEPGASFAPGEIVTEEELTPYLNGTIEQYINAGVIKPAKVEKKRDGQIRTEQQ